MLISNSTFLFPGNKRHAYTQYIPRGMKVETMTAENYI